MLAECVRRSGLREAYVAMDCLRGTPRPGEPRHPSSCRNYLAVFAIPWVWVMPPEVQARGAHLIVAKTPRIRDDCVDPRVKNFHWGDMTRALFEAQDQGAESCVLLDREGFVTEGPGFNVFAVTDGAVATPDRGALEGITRLSVAELCEDLRLPFAARPVTAAELRDADEIFLSTTAGGIMPVSRLDARILGNDRPGPISSLLRETFWAKRAQGLACDADRVRARFGGRDRSILAAPVDRELALEPAGEEGQHRADDQEDRRDEKVALRGEPQPLRILDRLLQRAKQVEEADDRHERGVLEQVDADGDDRGDRKPERLRPHDEQAGLPRL